LTRGRRSWPARGPALPAPAQAIPNGIGAARAAPECANCLPLAERPLPRAQAANRAFALRLADMPRRCASISGDSYSTAM